MKTYNLTKLNNIVFMFFLFIFSVCLNLNHVYAMESPTVFSTWEGFEVDKCASIWLIKGFINENAVIKFFPKGEKIDEGIPFDTPEAKFRRYHNMSTYESLLQHYKLIDPGLRYIGRIIHDIEVNIWERKIIRESRSVQNEINAIISNSQNRDDVINRSSHYFDVLYRNVLKQEQ